MSQPAEIAELIADVRERVLYLKELGVTALKVNLPDIRFHIQGSSAEDVPTSRPSPDINFELPKKVETIQPAQSRLLSLPSLSNRKSSGVPAQVANEVVAAIDVSASVPAPTMPTSISGSGAVARRMSNLPEPTETIEQIRQEIGPACTRCKLHALCRTKVVNSVGNFDADLMFVGEAPGADEDL